jgi:hypothetical protein
MQFIEKNLQAEDESKPKYREDANNPQ